jgi:hypothetical protein
MKIKQNITYNSPIKCCYNFRIQIKIFSKNNFKDGEEDKTIAILLKYVLRNIKI